MEKNAKIYVAGHTGMVGSAIIRKLKDSGYSNIIGKTLEELDLTDQQAVANFFDIEKPEYVFLAAARVGGIGAMASQPVEFLSDNLKIQCNIMDMSFKYKVKKLVFISSAAVYPKDASQPIKESELLSGSLEPAGEGYSIAKIAGIRLCAYYKKEYGANFVAAIPSNIYGPNGLFDIKRSHVVPAMVRRFHSAKVNGFKEVTIWGTGKARRELIYADDVADGCIYLMNNKTEDDCYNMGVGSDRSMIEIAESVKRVVGYNGDILCDSTRPEGAAKRLLDSSRINGIGWAPQISFDQGLEFTYKWFLENIKDKDEIYR